MADQVRITDVSPRDGLQNEPGAISTTDKARIVAALCAASVDEVELTSFVSPKWVPQLGDAAELCALVAPEAAARGGRPVFSALVPNERGLESLLAVNDRAGFGLISKASVFTAASETFSKKNTNATIAETIKRFEPVVRTAKAKGLAIRGYISCVIACPFEGPIAPDRVAHVAQALYDLGVDELDLGDTIGAGDAASTRLMLSAIIARLGDGVLPMITVHLHDTFARAAECVRESLAVGVRSFDGSVAGLGGCPYASTPGKPAPGNISTELLVRTVADAGYSTNVDAAKLAHAAEIAQEIVLASRAGGQR